MGKANEAKQNRIDTGDFDFDGTTYKGTYEPIVHRELWGTGSTGP